MGFLLLKYFQGSFKTDDSFRFKTRMEITCWPEKRKQMILKLGTPNCSCIVRIVLFVLYRKDSKDGKFSFSMRC